MKTVYYSGVIDTKDQGKLGVSVICGGETLEKALASLITSGTYYWALGDDVKIKEIRPYCASCQGSGRTRRGKRIIKYVNCPDCKGKGQGDVIITEIPLVPSTNISVSMA